MKRRLPLIFVAVVTVICLVAASVAAVASGVGGSAVAYSVNGTQVSQATVDGQLSDIANHPGVGKVETLFGIPVAATNGGISSRFAATWLTLKIQSELLRQAAADAKVSVNDAARAEQQARLDQQFATNNVNLRLADLPPVVQRTVLDYVAYPQALGIDSQAKRNSFFAAAAKDAVIRVDPRYGRWNQATLTVCPPTGCAPTPAAGG
jgi:hypothetical protein